MWFYMKMAWRNMFRNKRRTIIAGIAIGIGLASLILSMAVMRGMESNMIKSATASFLGEAQIHGDGFRDTQEVEKTVANLQQVTGKLKKEEIVERFTKRTIGMGMLSAPANVNAVIVVGIEPETEKFLSKIDDAVGEGKGDFFTGDNPRDIVIGSKLADVLEVSLGDRVVVTVAQAKTGDLGQEMFRVSGIYKFDIKEMDSGMAFIRLKKAQEMLGIGNGVHQIAVKFKDIQTASLKELPFWDDYSMAGNEAVSWITLMPQMKVVFEMTAITIGMMVIILGAVVVFGIINTLFMSLYERMFEFAVMRAVGTRPAGMRKLILLEAGALAIISIALGLVLGLALTLLLTHTGIDYRGIEFAGTTMHEMLYPEMHFTDFIYFPIGALVFTLAVGIYPAWAAGRLKIADALRKSL
ncbi:MAG: ABC transporter permease [bacterium]|nr:ABC transporter permease [bacterium]